MNWRSTTQLSEGAPSVGIRDWNRRLFDALISLPKGTSYNSYLIVGNSEKASWGGGALRHIQED